MLGGAIGYSQVRAEAHCLHASCELRGTRRTAGVVHGSGKRLRAQGDPKELLNDLATLRPTFLIGAPARVRPHPLAGHVPGGLPPDAWGAGQACATVRQAVIGACACRSGGRGV